MEDIIISIATKVSECLVDPAIREGNYLFCAGRITKNAENEKEKLMLTKDEVSRHAKEVERKAERIEDAVQNWQKEVESLLTEVENMEQQVKASSCFRGLCPTWRRYHLCKQLAIKTKRMTELNNNSKFQTFSRLATLPTIEYFSSGSFTLFESTKLAYNKLLEALRDNSCYMICLYGMGGCGKTTLAKEVGKKAKDLNLFEKVMFTTVSQTLDVKSIQDEIADFLSLRFEEQSKAGRARRLSLRLQSGEKILVILDDVWAKLNLEDIGIPLNGNLKGCKVLLTTRLQQLCTLMECQRNVPLHLLSEEEGWVLFQKKACLTNESSSELLNDMARQVSLECKGLPIAIEAVGTSLKGKPIDSWKDALTRLRHSKPIEVEEGVRDAFTCLQYSYDHLNTEEAKGLFLMCSMFPEDHDISTEDLFRYAIGLGLCKEVESFETSRSRVNNNLNYLVDSSLLMHSERRENHFKMHDMVRDVALWISSKEDHAIMVDHGKGISQMALDGVVENCYAVSCWYAWEEDQFPHQLDAPKLEILLLNLCSQFDFSDTSFEGTKKLKVMAIIKSNYAFQRRVSLPQSIKWLTNLQTLRLVNCELGDISFVVSLRNLEILDLRHSKFKSLPNGIEKQNKLKLLDLSYCITDDCCDEVLGRCSQLEELYAYSYEAYKFYRVITSTIIKSCKCFMENASFQKLQRYVLLIGEIILDEKTFLDLLSKRTRVLLLKDFDISSSSKIIESLFQRAEVVALDGFHGDFKSIFPELVQAVGSMKQLTELSLSSCTEIESLISTTHVCPVLVELSMFQKLEKVSISDCPQLQSIFGGKCNLCNLKVFSISDCPRLTSLFPISVAQTLLHLESLEVFNCFELQHIILMNEGNHCSDKAIEISPNSEIFNIMFPKLRSIKVRECAKLQFSLPISFHQGHVPLQYMEIEKAYGLTSVFGNRELGATNYGQMKCLFPREWKLNNLKVVRIYDVPKLISLFSVCVAQTLQLLEVLYVCNCKELKYIICNEEEDSVATRKQQHASEDLSSNQNQIQIVLPKLEKFELSDLPSLIEICSGNYHPFWPSLHIMDWRDCPNLITLCENLNIDLELTHPHLNMEFQLHVSKDAQVANEDSNIKAASTIMNELSIDEEKYKMLTSSVTRLDLAYIPNVMFIWINFQKISDLCLIRCQKLKSLFSASVIRSLPELSSLIIEECDELEEVISNPDFEQVIGNPSSSAHPQQVCFPNLEVLKVKKCQKMKCIFSLTKRSSDDAHDRELIEFVLSKLTILEIEELPSLVDICGGFQYQFQFQFQFQLQAFESCRVDDCPNLSSTTISTLNNFITVYADEETEEEEEKEELEEEEEEEEGEKDDEDCTTDQSVLL